MTAAATSEVAVWHDVECGGYAADLPLWRQLAKEAAGPILELGAGTGRVALDLARQGLEVSALDSSPELIAALRERAAAGGLACDARVADARDFHLGRRFAGVLAPMQFVHLVRDPGERARMLDSVRRALRPGGMFAAALLAGEARSDASDHAPSLLPDVRDLDGWIYSSLPLEVTRTGDALALRRLRQRVSPAGELTDEHNVVVLADLDPREFEAECERAGLSPRERMEVPATAEHVGSVVCVLEVPR